MNTSSLLNMVMGQIGDQGVDQISQQVGGTKQQTQSAIAAALPAIMGAMARNASKPEGAANLNNALEKDHDGSILGNLAGAFLGQQNNVGGAILGHVFGNKKPAIEQGVSQASGLNPQATGQLLMTLAPIVMGALGKARKEQNLDANGIAGMLNQEREQTEKQNPQLGFIGQMLDKDGDGSIMDDLAGGLMKGLFGG